MNIVTIGHHICFAPFGRPYSATTVLRTLVPTSSPAFGGTLVEPWLQMKAVTEAGIKTANEGGEKVFCPPEDASSGLFQVADETGGVNVQEWTFELAETDTPLLRRLMYGALDLTGTLAADFRPNQQSRWEGWLKVKQQSDLAVVTNHTIYGKISSVGEVKMGNKTCKFGFKFTVLDNALNTVDQA